LLTPSALTVFALTDFCVGGFVSPDSFADVFRAATKWTLKGSASWHLVHLGAARWTAVICYARSVICETELCFPKIQHSTLPKTRGFIYSSVLRSRKPCMMNNLENKQEDVLFPKRLPLVVNGAEIDLVRCPHLLICGKENLSTQITDLCQQLIHHKSSRYHQLRLCDLEQNVSQNLSEHERTTISNLDSTRQFLHLALKNAKERYEPLKTAKALDIYDFNRHKQEAWEQHLANTIHPEYLGGLWGGSERELFMQLPRKVVVIANLEPALAADPGNAEKLLRIVEIGRAVGVHVIAAADRLDDLPSELLSKFLLRELAGP